MTPVSLVDRNNESQCEDRVPSTTNYVCCFTRAAALFGVSWLLAAGGLAPAQSSSQRVESPAASAESRYGAQLKQDEDRFWVLLAKDPGDVGALAGMAWIRSRQGNYLAAIGFLEHARLRHPRDSSLDAALRLDRYRFFMAEAKTALARGDVATAHSRYRSALQIFPGDHAAYEGLQDTRAKSLAPR